MYAPEVATRLVPPPFKSSVGNAVLAKVATDTAEYRALPLEPTFEYLAFRKAYKMQILRLTGPQRWVLITCISRRSTPPSTTCRGAQVEALLRFAQAEYEPVRGS